MCMSLVVGVTAQRVNCLVADLMECGTHRGFERDLVMNDDDCIKRGRALV